MPRKSKSKAQRIRALLHLPTKEIAKRTGCPEAYVRAVRQRTDEDGNSTASNAERNWVPQRRVWLRNKYRTNKKHRERVLAAHQRYYRRNREKRLIYFRDRRARMTEAATP